MAGTLLSEVARVSAAVGRTASRTGKVALLAEALRRLEPGEAAIGIALLSGETPRGKLGVGPAWLRRSLPDGAAPVAALTLEEVARAFDEIASPTGPGAAAVRERRLRELFSRATREERDFLCRVLLGELRQGALEGVLVEAVARAYGVGADRVRRAHMVSGDLGEVARSLAAQGEAGLGRFALELFRPVEPMLAETAASLEEALARTAEAAVEYKIDGARVQVHKGGDTVEVYTRRGNRVTEAVPEIVEAVRALPARELILDGEAVSLRADGSPRPFQQTMRRFGRKLDVDALRQELPLHPFFFDCLRADGEDLLDAPAGERWRALEERVPAGLRIPRRKTAELSVAQRFLDAALAAGHEGVMVKALDAPYEAGRRGGAWLKVKPAHTLDLVVLAAEWGHGRRRGWLSNLHLGARDPAAESFAMVGKTFKGLTDEMLRWQTERLLALEIGRDDWTVTVRPELVVEIAFDGVQASPRYPAGVALRFARVKRYRPDKRPDEADTVEAVRRIHAAKGASSAFVRELR